MPQIGMRTEHRGSTDPGNRHGAVEGGVGPSPPSHYDPPPAPSWRSLLCYTCTRQNTLVFQYMTKNTYQQWPFKKNRTYSQLWLSDKTNFLKGVCWLVVVITLMMAIVKRTLVTCYHVFVFFLGSKGFWR